MPILDEYLKVFKCYDLLPLAQWIIYLAGVKEAIGYIPEDFELTWDEIKYLTIFQEEQHKKILKDQQTSHRQSMQSQSQLHSKLGHITSGRSFR